MYTIIPLIGRELKHSLVLDGVELLPGTSIWMSLNSMHHNPIVWGENHMDFIPERFLPENLDKMDPFAFCPFSAGPRLETPFNTYFTLSLR